jgi:glycine/D-amino acid oxidase-like deaminating enzyme
MAIDADVLIVGHGLAGAHAAHLLRNAGKFVVVFSDEKYKASSVAAGLWHPLRIRSMEFSWLAEEVFPFAHECYTRLEQEWETKFFHPKTMLHDIPDLNFQGVWKRQMEKLGNGLGFQKENHFRPSETGMGQILEAGWLDIPSFLASSKKNLGNDFIEKEFHHSQLVLKVDGVEYHGVNASIVLFCEGNRIALNPWFSYLPMNSAKGEVLTVKIQGLPEKEIYHAGFFLIPLGDQLFRFGSNFRWDRLDWEPSETDARALVEKLEKTIQKKVTVVEHRSGVRPANHSRRPFAGFHPEHSQLAILNAFGSKGVVLAPFLAQQWVNHWLHGTEMNPEVNPKTIKLPKIKEIKTTFVP